MERECPPGTFELEAEEVILSVILRVSGRSGECFAKLVRLQDQQPSAPHSSQVIQGSQMDTDFNSAAVAYAILIPLIIFGICRRRGNWKVLAILNTILNLAYFGVALVVSRFHEQSAVFLIIAAIVVYIIYFNLRIISNIREIAQIDRAEKELVEKIKKKKEELEAELEATDEPE